MEGGPWHSSITMSSAPSSSDRRTHTRVRLAAHLSMESASHVYAGLTRDISRGGIFVATHHARSIALGSDVLLDIQLDGGRHLQAHGVVRWHRAGSAEDPAGLGIAFTQLDAEAQAVLEELCETREPYFYEFDD
jgi:uncharacterized protein (TIGR02266 family)